MDEFLPVRTMMYAFGDAKEPASDSVDVMEDILIEYLTDVVRPLPPPSCALFHSSPFPVSHSSRAVA